MQETAPHPALHLGGMKNVHSDNANVAWAATGPRDVPIPHYLVVNY